MKGARRWAIVGLLCVCGVFGCAQLPSRGLFAQRTRPPTTEEPRAEVFSDSSDEDIVDDLSRDDRTQDRRAGARHDLERDSAAIMSHPSGPPSGASERSNFERLGSELASTDGLFDVSSRNAANTASDSVEAPPPIRRTSAPPGNFVAPPSLRALKSDTLSSSADMVGDRDGVVSAGYEVTSPQNASGIELAAAQRRSTSTTEAVSAPNPWNRFRDLTNDLDDLSSQQKRGVQPPADGNSPTNNSAAWPQEASNIAQLPSGPGALSQGVPSNTFDGSTNNANSPEPWPRAPGASGFGPTTNNFSTNNGMASSGHWDMAPAISVPPNVQRVNAEQPSSANFPTAAMNPQSPPLAGNLPLNFGSQDGTPLAIAPFAMSPELERLITQTTVEAAAMIPGDNEVSRQLYLRKHVQLRLLHLIVGQTDRALQPIPGIDPADQEFWQQMLWGMANYFDTQGMPDSSERATQTISQLRAAAARLQEKARLELHNVAFCHKISGFGNYQRFKRDEFTPGQPVLLYAEVADFKSEPTPDGQFRTLMKSTLEVLEGGPNGHLVESLPLAPSEDHCRNQRRDYYHSYEFTIPQSCNPGPHTLLLRVEDQLGKKTAVTRLNFTVQ